MMRVSGLEAASAVRVTARIDLRLPHADVFYECELRFDPGLQAADLWVNGEQRFVGYRGHTEFQDDMRLMFGAVPYKGGRGMASFQSVRFELTP